MSARYALLWGSEPPEDVCQLIRIQIQHLEK